MAKSNPTKVRNDIASALRNLGTVLTDEGILINNGTSPFDAAADECKNNHYFIPDHTPNTNTWGYTLNNVLLRVSKGKARHIHPTDATDITVEFSVAIRGLIDNYDKLADPFDTLSFNVIINAKHKADENIKYRSCWHLDRNIEGKESPEEAHPHYHFHFGGHNMEFNNSERAYGSTLFLDSPRIAHKPLDGILATDFILSNFASDRWKKLKDRMEGNTQYQNIVHQAQLLTWRPYAVSIAKNWDPIQFNQITWNVAEIWPQLIIKK